MLHSRHAKNQLLPTCKPINLVWDSQGWKKSWCLRRLRCLRRLHFKSRFTFADFRGCSQKQRGLLHLLTTARITDARRRQNTYGYCEHVQWDTAATGKFFHACFRCGLSSTRHLLQRWTITQGRAFDHEKTKNRYLEALKFKAADTDLIERGGGRKKGGNISTALLQPVLLATRVAKQETRLPDEKKERIC